MRDYIILNNKNSNEIEGLLIQNLPPITKPRIRTEIDEIDGRDGDIVTPLGYGAYDKTFSIGLYGNFDINEVIKYFDSEGIVVFSNEPNKYYNYKILEQIDFEKLIRFRTADVMMHIQPFKYSTTEGKETEEMETKTASGSEIDLPDTNNEKLQMEKLKGDAHQDTIDAEEGNENEDTNLAVNDVDPSKENYITLKGNTTQYNHDSVNMLPNDMATLSLYGITITKNDDGTYTINGTTTQDFNWAINDTALNLQANTNYFLSGCATGGDAETYCLYISAYADTGNGVLINSSRAINDQVRIFIASGQTFNNAIFKPMLIEGTEAIPFEPYGMTTPSPDYPSEVKVVKGNNVVSVSRKNLLLLPNQSITHQGVTINTYEDGRIVINGTATGIVNTIGFVLPKIIPYKSNKQYSFSLTYISGNATNLTGATTINLKKGVVGESSYGDFISITNMQNDYAKNFSKSITTTDENSITRLQFISYFSNQVFDNLTYKLQLEEGSTATDFEEYTKTDYPLSLGTLELCKIGDYKDYLFKRNGKWYVHKEITKKVFSGTENLVYSGSASTPNERTTARWNFQDYVNLANYFSNRFVYNSQSSNRIVLVVNSKTMYISIDNTITGINVEDDEGTKVSKIKNWLSNNNVSLYCVLDNATDTQITDTSLIAQLDNLHTAELQETSYINSTPAKEYPYINLKYNVVTPAPSPDRASEINKVTGNNVVSVQGKNLLPYTEQTFNEEKNGVTFTGENGIYTISGVPTTNTRSSNYQLVNEYTIKDGDYVHFLNDKSYGVVTFGFLFTDNTSLSPAQGPINRIYKFADAYIGKTIKQIYMYVTTAYDGEKITIKPMILNNISTYTDFVPYSKTDYPIPLGNIELCKIGDYQDYLYKNNGKWYVHKEIGKQIVDGTETYSIINAKEISTYFQVNRKTFIPTPSNKVPNAFTNYFIADTGGNLYSRDTQGFTFNSSGALRINILNSIATIVTDFQTWLTNNNVIVYYQLPTPTEEEITDETLLAQLEALDSIYNQKGTTYIKTNPEANNMPLTLDVSYTESRPITITNSGNIYSKPIFTIYGEGDIGVYLNDIQLFNINLGSEEQITIDVAEMQAYNKETKALKNRLVTGNYDKFLLKIGENKISFSGIVKKFEIENYSRWI